ncbi:hypothetical protein B0H13DRAFT_1871547 [Mycena leptocephala]|nr:hypothetical protein B0H13DRAFT_1871547 [Mycena leptocephala]
MSAPRGTQLQCSANSRGRRCGGAPLDRGVYIGVRWRREALDSRESGMQAAREARPAVAQMVVERRDSEARGPTHFLTTQIGRRLAHPWLGTSVRNASAGEAVHLDVYAFPGREPESEDDVDIARAGGCTQCMWIADPVYGYVQAPAPKAGRARSSHARGRCRLRELCSIQQIAHRGDVGAKSGEDQRRFCFFCGGGRSIHAFPGHESESWNDIDIAQAEVRGGWLAGSCMRVRAGQRRRRAESMGRDVVSRCSGGRQNERTCSRWGRQQSAQGGGSAVSFVRWGRSNFHIFPGRESESGNDIDIARAGVRGGSMSGRVRSSHADGVSSHAAPADGRMKGLETRRPHHPPISAEIVKNASTSHGKVYSWLGLHPEIRVSRLYLAGARESRIIS